MAQSHSDKKQRFARIFPNRVESVVDQFRKISNCSASKDYAYDRDTVAMVWVHVLLAMKASAKSFGLDLSFTINGQSFEELQRSGAISDLFEEPTPREVELPLF